MLISIFLGEHCHSRTRRMTYCCRMHNNRQNSFVNVLMRVAWFSSLWNVFTSCTLYKLILHKKLI
uniref:Uncharacterized protein n=1 Tax=Rhizophora mucronata TaxID=61149 RepID=A0A2P2NGY6_RHIMU